MRGCVFSSLQLNPSTEGRATAARGVLFVGSLRRSVEGEKERAAWAYLGTVKLADAHTDTRTAQARTDVDALAGLRVGAEGVTRVRGGVNRVQWFKRVDPLADDPKQIHLSPYAYAWNNPVNLTDPTGMMPFEGCLPESEGPFGGRMQRALAKAGDGAQTILSAFSGSVSAEGKFLGASASAELGPVKIKASLTGATASVSTGTDGTTASASVVSGEVSATFGPGDSPSDALTAGVSASGTLASGTVNLESGETSGNILMGSADASDGLADVAGAVGLENSGTLGGSVSASVVKVSASVDLHRVAEGAREMLSAVGEYFTSD